MTIGDQVGASFEFPFAPGRYHLYIGLQSIICELEPHLVISFSRSAVGNGVGTLSACDLDLFFCYDWTRERSAKQVNTFIQSIRFYSGPNEIFYKFLAQIFDIEL